MNPNTAINSLSGLIGIQQQRQALQTGQYQQQSAQAQAGQDQQRNRELQALAQFSANAVKDPNYQLPDGSLDVQKFQTGATAVAPTYGQPMIGQLTSNAKEAVATRQAIQSLSAAQNAQITAGLKGLANMPGGATQSDILNWAEQMEANNKDPAFGRAIKSAMLHMSSDPGGGYSNAAAKLAATVGGISMQEPGTQELAGAIQPVTTTTMGPNVGQQTPVGGKVTKTPAPWQMPGFVAAVTAAGSRATGVAGSDIDRSNQVSQAANTAPAAIQLSQSVDSLAQQIHSGQIAKGLSAAAAAAGLAPVVYARQLLNKDLGQLKTLAAANAGSDARMGTILSGYPDETSAERTIHTAMDYIRGSFRQSLARGQNLNAYRTKQPDLTGFQHSDDVLVQSTNPLMHEYTALKSPQERTEFYRRNFATAQEAAAFKAQVQGVSHSLGR
jgi:hypothetical protein